MFKLFRRKARAVDDAAGGGAVQPLPYYKRFWQQYVVLLYKQGACCSVLLRRFCRAHAVARPPAGHPRSFDFLVARCAGLLAQRNIGATLVRTVVAPFVFIALIWVVNEAVTKDNRSGRTSSSFERAHTSPSIVSVTAKATLTGPPRAMAAPAIWKCSRTRRIQCHRT